ncbi:MULTISPECIES: HvfC/BufC N-terminal domain-containing protein [Thiorhodovibrio]|uniref:HvfC/BufC N-terminal domain-containing protein n=1 Tax=Thiorhodovibrio TaxID=61593 RepID=UPI001911A278|nr:MULTISPECIES: DNA-binding domain-containing protein [Thiorhodovibrio]MBK5969097.1 hypothetical protein [Thiorhodovibrio winogradskyi]WPL12370.1 hypothetical protein Thiosp_02134 [Thiorhodovibrio litoralis]
MSEQNAWCGALLDPERAIPAGLTTWNGSDPAQRFAVYRNNVTLSLMGAIADTFPICQAVVGAARFRELARAFVRAHPPRSPILARYGASFADFIATNQLAEDWPYLSDLARLELACLDALHAADAAPIDPGTLTPLMAAPEQLASLRLELHPCLSGICCTYAVVSIWAAHQGEENAEIADPGVPESAWVLRHERSVRVLPMAVGDVRFIAALRAGLTLGEAAETASTQADFDLTRCLAVLLREQVLTGFHSTATT